MLIFYLLILLIPLLCIKIKKEDDKSILDYQSTTCIKGILCIYVMLHNLGLDYNGNSPVMAKICEHTGGIGVGVFFFLSAYGVIKAYQAKGNKYLLSLLFKNVLKLYIISVLINLLIYFVFFQNQFETTDLLLRIFNLDVFNGFSRMNLHGWYICTIIGMYIIFAIVFYLFSKLKTENKFKIAGIVLAVIAVMLRLLAIILDQGRLYTREMPCFAIGCIYATFFDQINAFLKKHFWPFFIVLFITLWFGMFFSEPVGAYSACLLIIILSQRITYKNNITLFLGKICLYIYLFVYFSSLITHPYINNQYWWILINAGLILELSLFAYFIERMITKIILKIKTMLSDKNKLCTK